MRMRLLFIVFLTLSYCLQSVGQKNISGIIRDKENGKPLESAIVTIFDNTSGEYLNYQLCDDKGTFNMIADSKPDSIRIIASLLGYASQTLALPNKTQNLDIALKPEVIRLKDVVVHAPKISFREDTLSYNVDAFRNNGDRVIGDVLKKLPGIEVLANGAIRYNGELINKFYIEGSDLLEDKYSIATNNVPADAIASVQVIENHQSIKSLKNLVYSDKAAINLKLKKDKLSKPVGNVQWEAGFTPLLWDMDLFGMQIGKKRQTLLTYKTNNTGKDITSELMSLDAGNDILSGKPPLPSDLVSPESFIMLPVRRNRFLFNKTYSVSLNNLWKVDEDTHLRLNVDYINNEEKQESKRKNVYYFTDKDSLVINESDILKKYSNQIDTRLTYNRNSQSYFLNNRLKFFGVWNTANSSVYGEDSLYQRFHTPLFALQNDFQLVKRINSRIYQFNSFVRYSSLPQELSVKYDSIAGEMTQDGKRGEFKTVNTLSYGYAWLQSNLQFELNLDATSDGLKSSLSASPLEFETNNDLKSSTFVAGITPVYTYRFSNINMTLKLPVSYNILTTSDGITGSHSDYSYFFVRPLISFNYKINFYWSSKISFGYDENIGDVSDFTRGYIMTNYRSFQRGNGNLSHQKIRLGLLNISFRDPLALFFFNARASYKIVSKNLLSKIDFSDIYLLSSYILSDNSRKTMNLTGNIGKYVNILKTTFSLGIDYNQMKISRIQQEIPMESTHTTMIIRPKADIKFGEGFNMTYQANLIRDKVLVSGFTNDFPVINQIYQYLDLYISPWKQWQLRAHAEYCYNELSKNEKSKLFFADLIVLYSLKQVNLTLSWNNIFNQKEYLYSSYDGPNRFSKQYELRPSSLMAGIHFKY